MKKLLVICGPTATGKTSLGIKLAKEYDGEIVSADSRQLYRYMDIGTGKDLPLNTKYKILNTKYKDYRLGYYLFDKVPVWLLDVVTPDFKFSVADYVKCANVVIKDIWKRGKLPILVGGTGFYIRGVVDGIGTMGILPDLKLRKKLSNLEIEKLREILKETCPERLRRMNESDRRNPRRLVRTIEIAKKMKNEKLNIKNTYKKLKINSLRIIGLTAPYKFLYEKIDKRVDERVKQRIVGEIKRLLAKGYSWENSALGQTIGYKEWKEYFIKALKHESIKTKLKENIIQIWKYAEHAYARRQMTWFKKDKRIHWFDITSKKWQDTVERLVKKWYSKNTCLKK